MGDAAGQLADRLHLLGLAQFLLDPLPAGEVAHEASKDALAVGDRFPNGQLHWKDAPVLALALDHPAVANDVPLAGSQITRDVAVMGVAVRLRHEQPDVAAHDLAFGVAEQSRRRRAERGNETILVDHHHRLGHRVENRSEMRFPRRQVELGILQFGEVSRALRIHSILVRNAGPWDGIPRIGPVQFGQTACRAPP